MATTIRLTDPVQTRIRDTSPCLPRVSAADVAAALGAEPAGEPYSLKLNLPPITLFALRAELFGRLQADGNGTAPAGTDRSPEIPLGDKEWGELKELTAAVTAPGFAPTAGQVAGVLLSLSVRSAMAQLAKK